MANELTFKKGSGAPESGNNFKRAEPLYDYSNDKLYISSTDNNTPTLVGGSSFSLLNHTHNLPNYAFMTIAVPGANIVAEDKEDTLNLTASTGVTIGGTVATDTIVFSIGQSVATDADVTFNDVTVDNDIFLDGSSILLFDALGSGHFDMQTHNIIRIKQLGFAGIGSVLVTGCLDEDAMVSDSSSVFCTQQSIKAYVDDNTTKCWSSSTHSIGLTLASTWYFGKNAMGTGTNPTAGEFDAGLLKQAGAPYFIAPYDLTMTAIGWAGAVSYANDFEIQFWKVCYDNEDTDADTLTKIGNTIAFTGNSTYMYRRTEVVSVSLSAGDLVVTVARYTSGATKKFVYINTVIQYEQG